MNKKTDIIDSNRLIFLLAAGIIFACFLPYFQAGIVYGSDEPYHLMRIYSLANEIKQGIFPVKIHHMACYGYGYGSGFFYSDALLYFPAILVALGVSLVVAYKIFALTVMIANFASVFYCVDRITARRDAAFFSASLFVLSNRVFNAFYVDFTIGEITGSIFIPIAITGMFLFMTRNQKTSMIIIGFVGLLYTHTLSVVFAFIVCLGILLVYFRRLNFDKIVKLIVAVVITAGISAAYWLPMLEQMKEQYLKYRTPWTKESDNVTSFLYGITDCRGMGIIIWLFLIMSLIFVLYQLIKKKDHSSIDKNGIVFFSVAALVCYILPSIKAVWEVFNRYFTLIQFPSRLYMLSSILTVLAVGGIIASVKMISKLTICAYATVMIINLITVYCTFGANMMHIVPIYQQVIAGEVAGSGAGEEWLPLSVDLSTLTEPEISYDDSGNQILGSKTNGYTRYSFLTDSDSEYYVVPYIYYDGYKAITSEGTRLSVYPSENGLLKVYFPDNVNDTTEVSVFYQGTKWQTIAYIISVLSTIIAVCLMWCKRASALKSLMHNGRIHEAKGD